MAQFYRSFMDIVLWYHMQMIYMLIIILAIGLILALAFLFVGIIQTCEIIHLATVHSLLIMMPIKELHEYNILLYCTEYIYCYIYCLLKLKPCGVQLFSE